MLNKFTVSAGLITVVAGLAALALILDAPRTGLTLLAVAVAGLPPLLVWGLRRQTAQLRAAQQAAQDGDAAALTLPAGAEADAVAQFRLVIARLAADELELSAARSRMQARLTELEQRLPPESGTP